MQRILLFLLLNRQWGQPKIVAIGQRLAMQEVVKHELMKHELMKQWVVRQEQGEPAFTKPVATSWQHLNI